MIKKYFLHIDVNYSNAFPDVDNAISPIVAITLYDIDNDNPIILCLPNFYELQYADKVFNDEVSLLTYMNDIFKESIIYGYNVYGFDISYMKARSKKLNITLTDITYRDMFIDIQKILTSLPSYGLTYVIQQITGEESSGDFLYHEYYKILYKYLYAVEIRDDKLKKLLQ